jgi:hypothetical protein
VTISGANLGEAKQVLFGSVAAKSFTVVSQTTIDAVSPAGTGTVDVTVTTPHGTSPAGPKDRFSYATAQPPAIISISPSQGPVTGGTEVKISGTNLGEVSEVHFGSVAASSFKLISASALSAVSPAGSGTVDISVGSPAGTSEVSSADRFTYVEGGTLPSVTKVSPSKGAAIGGANVTVKGTNLAGVTSVTFAGAPAASFKLISATKLEAVAPPGATGTADVRVTNAAGTSEISTKDHYAYGAPTVTGVAPSSGPHEGGTSVTVSGSGFALGSSTIFKFGRYPAVAVSCASTTQCTMTTAASTKAETVDVRATSGGQTSKRNTPADDFSYQ